MSNTITNPSPPKIGVDGGGVKERCMPDIQVHTTNGPFKPMLAKVYEPGVTGLRWPVTVQPKYDGVRALWDGIQIRSRWGKDSLAVPGEILEVLEQEFKGIALDGELYAHGMGFEAVSGAARRRSGGSAMADALQYIVFDMPTSEGFEDRVRHLEEMFRGDEGSQKYERVVLSPWIQILDTTDLHECMHMWTSQGYEGVMIRRLGMGYEQRRTAQLLKWKRTLRARAIVTSVVPGKGKHVGRMGALWVRGVDVPWRCKIGTGFSDAEREWSESMWIGRVIPIKYQELSIYGVPRSARRVREE